MSLQLRLCMLAVFLAVLKSNILTLNKFKHEKFCQLFCKGRVGLQPLVVSMSVYVYPHQYSQLSESFLHGISLLQGISLAFTAVRELLHQCLCQYQYSQLSKSFFYKKFQIQIKPTYLGFYSFNYFDSHPGLIFLK